jgi:hypothetical protein
MELDAADVDGVGRASLCDTGSSTTPSTWVSLRANTAPNACSVGTCNVTSWGVVAACTRHDSKGDALKLRG